LPDPFCPKRTVKSGVEVQLLVGGQSINTLDSGQADKFQYLFF
jgi:hypothetical protein